MAREILERQPRALIGVEQLCSSLGRGPTEDEVGKGVRKLCEADTVTPWIRVAAAGDLDTAFGLGGVNDLRQFAHLIVLVGTADVESLTMHELAWGFEQSESRAGDVFNVNERPPGSPIAEDPDLARGVCPSGEVVEHDVCTQAGETPKAVALRMKMGVKSSSARRRSACSARTFDAAYGVNGLSGALSSTSSAAVERPYMLHEEAKTKRLTPACFAERARLRLARKLISSVSDGSRSPSGSFESAARCTIAS